MQAARGFMHESDSSSGTPSVTPASPRRLVQGGERRHDVDVVVQTSESAADIALKNAGVASGNGLPARDRFAMRWMPAPAQ